MPTEIGSLAFQMDANRDRFSRLPDGCQPREFLSPSRWMPTERGSLAFQMDANRERFIKIDAALKNNQGEMNAEIKAGQERMGATREEMEIN
jgi:hypothetical protein